MNFVLYEIFFLFFTFTFFSNFLFAQVDREPIPETYVKLVHTKSGNLVFGRIIDIQTNNGIEATSIQLSKSYRPHRRTASRFFDRSHVEKAEWRFFF